MVGDVYLDTSSDRTFSGDRVELGIDDGISPVVFLEQSLLLFLLP